MKRNVIANIVGFGLLIVLGLFAARVIFIYEKIQKGESLADLDISFTTRLTTGKSLTQPLVANEEVVDVVTDDDPSIGSPDALLTVVEFADFSCPFSAEASYVVRSISAAYPNEVRFIFRDFPLVDIHPDAGMAHMAGACANEQGKFWVYHDKLFQNQDDFSKSSLKRYALEAGLDETAFSLCLESGKFAQDVEEDFSAGALAGVYGTPTFFINGYKVEGAIPREIFESIVKNFSKQPSD